VKIKEQTLRLRPVVFIIHIISDRSFTNATQMAYYGQYNFMTRWDDLYVSNEAACVCEQKLQGEIGESWVLRGGWVKRYGGFLTGKCCSLVNCSCTNQAGRG
jgi:hypothetical protein